MFRTPVESLSQWFNIFGTQIEALSRFAKAFPSLFKLIQQLEKKQSKLYNEVEVIRKARAKDPQSYPKKTLEEKKFEIISKLNKDIQCEIDRYHKKLCKNAKEEIIEQYYCISMISLKVTLSYHVDKDILGTPRNYNKQLAVIGVETSAMGVAGILSGGSSWFLILNNVFMAKEVAGLGLLATGYLNFTPETLQVLTALYTQVNLIEKHLIFQMAHNKSNWYAVLDLKKGASIQEINQHFRQLALKYHPDKFANKDEEIIKNAALTFIMIKRAHEILSNPETKLLYDLSLGLGRDHAVKRLGCR